jgi:hypothetical protein
MGVRGKGQWHLLEEHQLGEQILGTVNLHLQAKIILTAISFAGLQSGWYRSLATFNSF